MILQGSQRAGAGALAAHLLNDRDNDHVTVFEVRGFVADDLRGALTEAQAVSRGTRCQQYLFSLSLNPPKGAEVGEADFIAAADRAEKALGLDGQPRAVIFHEKEGRRHAHVVWSRIDAEQMRAINLSHYKRKLTRLSRELYLDHGWALPEGLRSHGGKSPLNFSLAEWQQAKRLGLDPREIKDVFQEAWKHADGARAFTAALEDRGYFLARGDRRGLVAVDIEGEVFSVPRLLGIKTREVRERLGSGDALPSVDETRAAVAARMTDRLKAFVKETKDRQSGDLRPLQSQRIAYRDQHRAERARLATKQAERWLAESNERQARLRTGLAGLWDRVSGKAAIVRRENEADALDGLRRDRAQRDQLSLAQRSERNAIQHRIDTMRLRHIEERKRLHIDVMRFIRMGREPEQRLGFKSLAPPGRDPPRKRGFSLDI